MRMGACEPRDSFPALIGNATFHSKTPLCVLLWSKTSLIPVPRPGSGLEERATVTPKGALRPREELQAVIYVSWKT